MIKNVGTRGEDDGDDSLFDPCFELLPLFLNNFVFLNFSILTWTPISQNYAKSSQQL